MPKALAEADPTMNPVAKLPAMMSPWSMADLGIRLGSSDLVAMRTPVRNPAMGAAYLPCDKVVPSSVVVGARKPSAVRTKANRRQLH